MMGMGRLRVRSRLQSMKTRKAVDAARASGKVPTYKAPRRPDSTYAMGHNMGYKDTSAVVSGPRHERHALGARIKKSTAGEHYGPFWQGYRSGVRKSADDWMNHIDKATGGRKTRAYRRVRSYLDKL